MNLSIEQILNKEYATIQRELNTISSETKKQFQSMVLESTKETNKTNSLATNNELLKQPSSIETDNSYTSARPGNANSVSPYELNFIINTPVSNETKYNEIIKEMSQKYGVSEKLISKVIDVESNYKEDAVSSAGAQGLMQLMPKTAEWLGVKDSLNPRDNIEGGTKYLKMMLDRYDNNLPLALAAYNAGPGNVDKYGGIPPFKETQNYVQKILGSV